ncbi:MAG: C40 family peptidase [Firmicutes bacterium]|nr:C40 family peptidase [Bacillota bacterium]
MLLHKLTSAVIFSSIFTIGFSFSAMAAVEGTINGSNVNVRAEKNTSAEKVDTLNEGDVVEIIEKDGDWYKISSKNADEAYISAEYIDVSSVKGTINESDVNVRQSASTSSEVVGKVNSGDTVTVTAQNGDWYQIRRGSGETAYINKDYVTGDMLDGVGEFSGGESEAATQTYAIVTGSSLRLRSSASTESEVITTLPLDDVLDVLEVNGDWVKVSTYDGETGYVSGEFVAVRNGEKPSRSISSKGDSIVSYAKQFLGTPYSWAGTNLNSGVDCSGFVYAVMKNFGISLNRSSADMAYNGVYVERANLQAGDLVFFDTTNATNKGYISHVGIYMGDGRIIHSSSGKQWGVTINSLSEDYYNTKYVTARRVLR